MRTKLIILTIIISFLAGVNAFLIFAYPADKENASAQLSLNLNDNGQASYVLPLSGPSYFPILNTNIQRPAVGAKSALVYDVRSGRSLFEKDVDQKVPIASLTKIIAATVILDNFNMQDIVKVPKTAIKVDGERQDLYENEQLSVENLLKIMLIESSNDAAYALADYGRQKGIDFVAKMNDKANQIGMLNSKFFDPSGLNDSGYSTAQDLSKLIKYALKYTEVWSLLTQKDAVVKSADGKIEHNVQNTNLLLGQIPNIVGGKTGYTDSALGCLILIVEIPGKDDNIVSIILGSKDRFRDSEKLVNWVKDAYRWQ